MKEILARNLKLIRKVKRINQVDFAKGCGISLETLATIEKQKANPKISTLQKIAKYAGCNMPELLKKEGNLNLNM